MQSLVYLNFSDKIIISRDTCPFNSLKAVKNCLLAPYVIIAHDTVVELCFNRFFFFHFYYIFLPVSLLGEV